MEPDTAEAKPTQDELAAKLDELLPALNKLLMELDDALQEYAATGPPPEDACMYLVRANIAKGSMKDVYDSFTKRVGDLINLKEVFLPDGSIVEKKWSADRSGWRHKDLARDVAKRLSDMSVDMDTGEVLMSGEEMVVRLLDYCQPSYWRITDLKEIGLNADMYSTVGTSKASIIVRKPKV